ncbi:hypothetical protein E4L96_19130 [Massilia arenosa]|uniref:SH3 domain-containing protein n=1 Tax=Zemynaea arenosa TaxID=2561931 RepID=A0A4Y9S1C3_9BURK|nr:hypothetical protein [Massilia arenosa]TFW13729.1 hypothetical protein E4L96_19130 [Massilia arenosa]
MSIPHLSPEPRRTLAALVLALLAAGSALAADTITAVKGKDIELYAAPDDAKPGVRLAPAGLPWTIKEEKNSFYRVNVGGKDGWVDGMMVTVARGSADQCPTLTAATKLSKQAENNAASPGAGAARCR